MELNAKLDVDVLALQQEDEVTCLLTFDAPVPPGVADRPGETLVVVVDRSGSMRGEPLEAVRSSLHALLARVKPQDTVGVVTFDSTAAIAVPARPIRDHHLPTVHSLVDAIRPGGQTDLSSGYLLGLSEARRNLGATGATVLLLSDGHANAGIIDPVQVGRLAAGARDERITTSTIGIGTGYDESLLSEVATCGNGSHRFAFTPDDAAAVVGEEAGDLLSKAIVNAFVRITPTDPSMIDRIGTLHDVPRWIEADDTGAPVVVIPLGDLYAGSRASCSCTSPCPPSRPSGTTIWPPSASTTSPCRASRPRPSPGRWPSTSCRATRRPAGYPTPPSPRRGCSPRRPEPSARPARRSGTATPTQPSASWPSRRLVCARPCR